MWPALLTAIGVLTLAGYLGLILLFGRKSLFLPKLLVEGTEVYGFLSILVAALLPVAVASRTFFSSPTTIPKSRIRKTLEAIVILAAAANLVPVAGLSFIALSFGSGGDLAPLH